MSVGDAQRFLDRVESDATLRSAFDELDLISGGFSIADSFRALCAQTVIPLPWC